MSPATAEASDDVCMFLRGVPESVRRKFRSTCVLEQKSMRDVMIVLMRLYTINNDVRERVDHEIRGSAS